MLAVPARTPKAASVATVTTIRTEPEFLALADEWRELLSGSDADSLFLTWEWMWSWWNTLAEDRELSIEAVRCDGRLVALAPLCRRPAGLRAAGAVPAMEFLGSGAVGSDYLDIIVRRGWELEASEALAAHLGQTRHVLRWTSVASNQSSAAGVSALLNSDGWDVREAVTNICPYIPLAGKSWEDYLASLGAEHRYNFHRKWRRLNREYRVSFDHASTELECREAIDLTIELHGMRWRERGDSEAFQTPGLVAFHRKFTQAALRRGWLRLYVLRLNEKPAACLYGFQFSGKFYFYQSGFDPAYEKYSVGMISMGLGIQKAIEEGLSEYDMLHGDEAYKFHWTQHTREIGRVELYPPGTRGWLARSAVEFERASRRLARRAIAGWK